MAGLNVRPLAAAALAGVLRPMLAEINMVSAPAVAKARGLTFTESRQETSPIYDSLMRVTVATDLGRRAFAGAVIAGAPRIVEVKGMELDAAFAPAMLYVNNLDQPGFIGALGHLLSEAGSTSPPSTSVAWPPAPTPSRSSASIRRRTRPCSPASAPCRTSRRRAPCGFEPDEWTAEAISIRAAGAVPNGQRTSAAAPRVQMDRRRRLFRRPRGDIQQIAAVAGRGEAFARGLQLFHAIQPCGKAISSRQAMWTPWRFCSVRTNSRGLQQAVVRAGVEPGVPARHQLDVEIARLDVACG